MKAILLCLALVAALPAARAQPESPVDAERARIAAERSQADAKLATQEAACYRKFAVTDCLNAARAQRRERLSDLRRQELTLNDAERKRRAAERVRSIEDRNSAQQQEENAARRAESVAKFKEHQAALAQRAAERARNASSAPERVARPGREPQERKAATRTARAQREHDASEELRRHDQRVEEAKERRERVARRLSEARSVKPLPAPAP
jgi:colicin import membrane protein